MHQTPINSLQHEKTRPSFAKVGLGACRNEQDSFGDPRRLAEQKACRFIT